MSERHAEAACRDARARLARDVIAGADGRPLPSSGERAVAREHLLRCVACRVHVDQLSRAVLSGAADELPCAEVSARLLEWVASRAAGRDSVVDHPLVAAHLATCSECLSEEKVLAQSLVELERGMALEDGGTRWVLSFLPDEPTVQGRSPRSVGTGDSTRMASDA